MKNAEEFRRGFCSRLHVALDNSAVRKRGRGIDISKMLEREGRSVTPQAVSKWLNASAIPEHSTLYLLAGCLGVSPQWLEYGVEPEHMPRTNKENGFVGSGFRLVSVLSWKNNGQLSLADSPCTEKFVCSVPISHRGYALKVLGDSMLGCGKGKSYPSGGIIFVEPDSQAAEGDSVIACIRDAEELVFKVLVKDAGRFYLKSVNPQYPILEVTDEVNICGKVIGLFLSE